MTKMAPVQGYAPGIPWSLHLEAYHAYGKKYGAQQALIEGTCRGGFHVEELDEFIPGWRDRLQPVISVEQQLACVRREIGMREHVYPRWVGMGAMTQAKADEELATMRAVLATLDALPKTQGGLFDG